mgnify:CR=1 FL=1
MKSRRFVGMCVARVWKRECAATIRAYVSPAVETCVRVLAYAGTMPIRRLLASALLVAMPCLASAGLMKDVTFHEPSPLAGAGELARRLLPRDAYERIAPQLASARALSVDLANERFAVYVPDAAPPRGGYGVLVFVPPWTQAAVQRDWLRVLDRHALIFVTAANSGNDADTLDRRIPLALLAYENIRRRYPIDPARTYVGGFSGGSRVALRIALGWPDVFRGALLDAGSDPIGGERGLVVPPAELLSRFQESTRLVLFSGARDEINVHNDLLAARSLRAWCVQHVATMTMPRRGHEIADAAGLARAIDALDEPNAADATELAECRRNLARHD